MILCLDTSTSICSVALCDSKGIVALKENKEGRSHASGLTVLISEILAEGGMTASGLEAVAVSKGPGSYTGLRIGVSVAKGIAYASSIPLISVETTLSMFYGITDDLREKYGANSDSLFVPMIDARRMEVYYAVFSPEGTVVRETAAEIINENTFSTAGESGLILIFGDGAAKCRDILKGKNIKHIDEFTNSASHMYVPVYKAFKDQRFEDVAYFEPFYLKDFITSQPKKKISGR